MVVVESTHEVADQAGALAAGRDYPRTYREFVEMFPDAVACAGYLEQTAMATTGNHNL